MATLVLDKEGIIVVVTSGKYCGVLMMVWFLGGFLYLF
jgi:hypothetical protein